MFFHDATDRIRAAAIWLGLQLKTSGIAVFVPDLEDAARLDRLLWEQAPVGFTAHCESNNILSSETPIVLFKSPPARWPKSILLNLSAVVPPQVEEIEHLVEIVSKDHAGRTEGRSRFRAYQAAGFDIETRNIEQDPLA